MNRIERSSASPERDLMTFAEALDYFRVSKSTLLKAIQSGEIVAYKLGSQWRVRKYFRDELTPWLDGVKLGYAANSPSFEGD